MAVPQQKGVRAFALALLLILLGARAFDALQNPDTQTAGRPIPDSFFGLTVLNFSSLSPAMRFQTTRSWDAYPNLDWAEVNPSKGRFDFSDLDRFIDLNRLANRDIVYTLGRTPRWASSKPDAPGPYGPGQCAPPADLSDYDAYLRAVATHAAGRIKYWELWNEADDPHFYCGEISTMVMLAAHASRIVKSIDPSAQILSPAVTGGPGPAWLKAFLDAGGGAFVDVIAFHGYWSNRAEDVLGVIESYRKAINGAHAVNKPMWDTESSWSGFGNLGTPDSSSQVGFLAKDYLLHWSAGVSRFVWYAYDGGPIWGGLWTAAAGESPAATAYREIHRWMAGATLTAPCTADDRQIWTCPLTRPGGYRAEAIWISGSSTHPRVPAQYTVYRDLAGVVHPIEGGGATIGDQPILLETRDIGDSANP